MSIKKSNMAGKTAKPSKFKKWIPGKIIKRIKERIRKIPNYKKFDKEKAGMQSPRQTTHKKSMLKRTG